MFVVATPVTPIRERTADKLNAPWTAGMVAEVTMPSGACHSTVYKKMLHSACRRGTLQHTHMGVIKNIAIP